MKHILIYSVVLLFCVLAHPACATVEKSAPQDHHTTFSESPDFQKINVTLRHLWKKYEEDPVLFQTPLQCLIKIDGSMTAARREAFVTSGATLQSEMQDIISARMTISHLPDVARLDWVLVIEGNTIIHQK